MSIPNFIEYFVELRNVPAEWKEAQNFLNWYLEQLANLTNGKTIGLYTPNETPSGKQISQGQSSIDVLRKRVVIGSLPNTTSKSTAHGVPVDSTFRIVNLYLQANDPVNLKFFCLEYWSLNTGDSIRLDIEGADIIISTQSDYSAYTDCFVVMEYTRGTS